MKPLRLLPLTDEEVLKNVKVASPCHESWAAMSGGDRIRSCERCQKKVYNLSEMTAAEAVALVRETEGKVCVRFHRRADGTMMTADCPVGADATRQRRVRRVAAFSGAAAAMAGIGLFRSESRETQVVETVSAALEPNVVMGAVAPEPAHVMGEMAVVDVVEPAVQGRMIVQDSAKRFLQTERVEVEVSRDARPDPFVAGGRSK